MPPIYVNRKGKNDVVFRAGDNRSTLDEALLEKASEYADAASK